MPKRFVLVGSVLVGLACMARATDTSATQPPSTQAKPQSKTSKSTSSKTSSAAHSSGKTSASTHSSGTTHQASSGHSKSHKSTKTKKSAKSWKKHGQHGIQSDRTREIQQALIRQHYLEGEANGVWDTRSQEAMRRFQADNGWQTKVLPDSRALIKLGLGPDHSAVLNPETAATSPYQPGGGERSSASGDSAGESTKSPRPVKATPQ
ncbi:MAG TPA: peptidoglycan-binding domain-containing protein [Terriglobales bacterium]|nr:peptidoglycan-binding domain-containing protein [Terriglobales bacterium]